MVQYTLDKCHKEKSKERVYIYLIPMIYTMEIGLKILWMAMALIFLHLEKSIRENLKKDLSRVMGSAIMRMVESMRDRGLIIIK